MNILIRLLFGIALLFIHSDSFAAICTSRTESGTSSFSDERINKAYNGKDATVFVTCDNSGSEVPESIYLRFHYPALDSIRLYEVTKNGSLSFLEDIGDWVPASTRTIKVIKPSFRLSLAANEIRHYRILVRSEGSLQLTHEFLNSNDFIRAVEGETFKLAIYYGIILALVGFNLFLFVQTRQIAFGLYVLYMLSYALFMANMDGISHLYFWGNHIWWSNFSTNAIIPTFLSFMFWFTGFFLRNGRHSGLIFRICSYLGILTLAYAGFAFFLPYRVTSVIGALLSVITILVLLLIGIWASLHDAVARYYTVAWGCLFVGMLMIVIRNFGIIPGSALVDYAMHIGSGSEAILLSLGLGASIRRTENERVILEKKAENLTFVSLAMQNLAHDIKNQLAIFELISRSKNWSEFLEWQASLSGAIARIQNIISEFGKDIDELPLQMSPETVDFSELANDANRVLGSDKARIFSTSDPTTLYLVIDRVAIERAIFNLVANAVEAGADSISIDAKAMTGDLHIAVRDNGPGISPQLKDKIFLRGESFGKPSGQGIGLYNVKNIVEGHGGTVAYRREADQTVFEMVLPGVVIEKIENGNDMVAEPLPLEKLSSQLSILVSLDRSEKVDALLAALANYPFKIYEKMPKETLPSLVVTDNENIIQHYLERSIPVMMGCSLDRPAIIARRIARRLQLFSGNRQFGDSCDG